MALRSKASTLLYPTVSAYPCSGRIGVAKMESEEKLSLAHKNTRTDYQSRTKREHKKYDKKLTSMKKYAPFLGKVIRKLEKKRINVRPKHLSAAKVFHSILTEKTKRLKMDNLLILEKVLKDLYSKKQLLGIQTRPDKSKRSHEKETKPKPSMSLCPVCRGFLKIKSDIKCFACSGTGKVSVKEGEEWWQVLFTHRRDPNLKCGLRSWPKSIPINCLPTAWKGEGKDIEFVKEREKSWQKQFAEWKEKDAKPKEIQSLHPTVIVDKSRNASKPSKAKLPRTTKLVWPTAAHYETIDSVLPPSETDLHLCPVCKGRGQLFTLGVCLACTGHGIMNQSSAVIWWQQVTRNQSGIPFPYEQCALPYNILARDLPAGWVGNPELIKCAMAAQVYWQHAMNQWKLQNGWAQQEDVVITNVSLEPSAEQHLVGLEPPHITQPKRMLKSAKKMNSNRQRTLTTIACNCDLSSSSSSTVKKSENNQVLCSYCRGHCFILETACPACDTKGIVIKSVARRWWKKLLQFRLVHITQENPMWTLAMLPGGIKPCDVPKEWKGQSTIVEETVRFANLCAQGRKRGKKKKEKSL